MELPHAFPNSALAFDIFPALGSGTNYSIRWVGVSRQKNRKRKGEKARKEAEVEVGGGGWGEQGAAACFAGAPGRRAGCGISDRP